MSERVLVTGAGGFVGRQIVSHLSGLDVHCVSRTPVPRDDRWHAVELRDPGDCRRLVQTVRPTILVHAAWETEHGAFWEAESNREWFAAGRALFSAFVEAGGRRIVGLGTCAEYPPSEGPLKEEDDTGVPATLYGQAKRRLLDHLHTLGVHSAWARIFHVYGPGEDPRRFVPQVAHALACGRPADCTSGQQVRDLIDVRDLGRAIAQLVVSDVTGPINLGSGAPTSLGAVATLLGAIADRPALVRLGALPDRPGETRVLIPDLTRQRHELGFSPRIPLRRGLEDAFRFWAQDSVGRRSARDPDDAREGAR